MIKKSSISLILLWIILKLSSHLITIILVELILGNLGVRNGGART